MTREEHKAITGFGTPQEFAAYELGKEHEQRVIIDFIEKWDGERNSALGDLLHKKFVKEFAVPDRKELPEPSFDSDGYPTDAFLEQIEQFMPSGNMVEFFDIIIGAWYYGEPYSMRNGSDVRLSTGGWSGNESIIGAMQSNFIVWSMTWQCSRAGGHHEFKIKQ